ncbi:MAG: hypothetical protein SGPRY_002751 [Prymnesium sp.]
MESNKPRLPNRFKDIVSQTTILVYEADEEAYVEGWIPIPAEEEAESEQAFLFKVRRDLPR